MASYVQTVHWYRPDLARSTASAESNDEDHGQPSCLWIPNLRTHNHSRPSDTIKGQMSVSDLDTATERPQLHTKKQGSLSKIFWSFEQLQSSSTESFVEKNSHGKAKWLIKCSLSSNMWFFSKCYYILQYDPPNLGPLDIHLALSRTSADCHMVPHHWSILGLAIVNETALCFGACKMHCFLWDWCLHSLDFQDKGEHHATPSESLWTLQLLCWMGGFCNPQEIETNLQWQWPKI